MSTRPMYPIAPLIAKVEAIARQRDLSIYRFCDEAGLGDWARLLKRGAITQKRADRVCCKLGMHPSEVWGSEAA